MSLDNDTRLALMHLHPSYDLAPATNHGVVEPSTPLFNFNQFSTRIAVALVAISCLTLAL